MKKIIGILAAAALLFAVSSCANDDGTSTVDKAVTNAQDVSLVADEAKAKAAEVAAKKPGGDDDEDDDENALTGTWTAADYYPTEPSSKEDDKKAVSGSLGKVSVVGDGAVWRLASTKDYTKGWGHLELGKAKAGCLQVTIGKTSTVVVSAASTGSSNTSDIFLGTSSGSTAGKADLTSVTGSSYTNVTYTSVPAGTYYLGAFPATTNERGVRIQSITVTAD